MGEELKSFKESHRREYIQDYQKRYRAQNKRVTFFLSKEQYASLEPVAKSQGMKVGAYVREAAFAYLNQVFLLPDDDQVHQLEIGIRRIGNNINQVVHRFHQGELEGTEVVREIQQKVNQLEEGVSAIFREPESLAVVLQRECKKHPELLDRVKEMIAKLEGK